jgi:hypothetical protein
VPAQYSPCGTLQHDETNRFKPKPAINKKFVREKVSRAYSILHLNLIPPSDDSNRVSEITEVEEEEDSDADVDQEQHQRHLKHVTSVRDRTVRDFPLLEKFCISCFM